MIRIPSAKPRSTRLPYLAARPRRRGAGTARDGSVRNWLHHATVEKLKACALQARVIPIPTRS